MGKRGFSLVIALGMVAIFLGACAGPVTTTSQQPIEVISVSGPLPPINPGGPIVEITLKNVSSEPVVSLSASLGISRAGPSSAPFTFSFNVSPSNPLPPGASISDRLTLINGGFGDDILYPLAVEGKLQGGVAFSFTEQVKITKP
jgi:hypothetical protein